MKMIHTLPVIALLAILSLNCTSTSVTFYVDPSYTAHRFEKTLVVANTNKLSDRFALEDKLVDKFSERGVDAFAGYKLFPPTRNLADSTKQRLMIEQGIDCCLMITFGEQGITQELVPVIGSVTRGNTDGRNFSSSTVYIGGNTLNKPFAEFEIKLFDIKTGNTAWMANSHTGGGALSDFTSVYSSFADKLLDALHATKTIIGKRAEIERIYKARAKNLGEVSSFDDVITTKDGRVHTGKIVNFKRDTYFNTLISVQIEDLAGKEVNIEYNNISSVTQKPKEGR